MTPAAPGQPLAILVFRIMTTRLGIDARQIARTTRLPAPPATAGTGLHYFHERVPFAMAVETYQAPAILYPATGLGVTGGLIVDQLEQLQTLDSRSIRRLPRWLNPPHRPHPCWGIAMQDDGLILLMDLAKVLCPGPSLSQ
ncbi:MAG: hypothetical protein H7838_04660 [Magnetococcus sp. DMHC-8]